ncbi:hypothetical protein PI124_g14454 [Phytophthora idaei]|nr:hypothetical protein PI125_g14214 [Phytophthora idaei]KAG3146396.1 hypothetical protein PI126_g13338 [Phytophthora idaei]KAG3240650.1 hypothetical protein PI124_g14454 [Phytophthora idaei]
MLVIDCSFSLLSRSLTHADLIARVLVALAVTGVLQDLLSLEFSVLASSLELSVSLSLLEFSFLVFVERVADLVAVVLIARIVGAALDAEMD